RLEGSPEDTSGGISYVFLMFYTFISCIFLSYFTVLSKQLQRLYTGGSIFKYHQCIIIAPIVIPRNFLCIFLFYSFISYVFLLYFIVLLKQLRRLYTSGFIFQVPPVSNYITCRTNRVPTRSVRQVRVYAFGAPTTRLRVWCTPRALSNQGGGASVYRPRSLPQYNRQSPPSKRAYDTIRISCP